VRFIVLPNPGDTEREASDWFARMSADDVTADDRARFETWLRTYSCNEKAYAELTATWKELVRSGPLVRAVHFGQVMNAASARSVRSPHWLAGAVAATIGAIVLGIGWNLYRQKEETRFQTAIGEQAAVALPDGSSFDLNTNSRVEVDYSQRTRVIRLDRGEAYFKVAHDTHRPFWVHAGDRWVRAVGTCIQRLLATRRRRSHCQRRHCQRCQCGRGRVSSIGRVVYQICGIRDCRRAS